MPTPKEGYFLKDGTKVPGTTTITGRYKDSGGLMDWVWDQGVAGIPWRETRDKAGEKGTSIHAMLQDQFEVIPNLVWQGLNHIEIIEQEISLVSEIYKYGGTIDAIGKDTKGRHCLLDWKTSKGFYQEHMLQVAAYSELWNENNPTRRITGGVYVVRFTKKGSFTKFIAFDLPETPDCPSLDLAWIHFRDSIPMYKREKPLKDLLNEALVYTKGDRENDNTA